MQISECRPDCKSSFRLQISQNAATDCRLGAHEVLADCRLQIAGHAVAEFCEVPDQIADCRLQSLQGQIAVGNLNLEADCRLQIAVTTCHVSTQGNLNLKTDCRLQISDDCHSRG